jgi:hypothetical protein
MPYFLNGMEKKRVGYGNVFFNAGSSDPNNAFYP